MSGFAKKFVLVSVAAIALLFPAGCDDLNLREASSAGVFDFVSGSVSSLLFELVPVG